MSKIAPVTPESIAEAAALLRAGKLVAFPTETVYGLGGDARNGQAVAAIYAAKGRPSFNPLIVHVPEAEALNDLIDWTPEARTLAAHFWPGPMTLVLPRKASAEVSLLVSAGLDTLAVRVPSHPVARELLRAAAIPVAAPSANASGKLSPTTPAHVAESLGDKVDLILAGGKTQVGVESTVINMVGERPVILRPGGVTREQLAMVLKRPVDVFVPRATEKSPASSALPSPGMLSSHYAPNLPVRLNVTTPQAGEAYLAFGPELRKGASADEGFLNLSPSGDLNEAAANLFAMMRELDRAPFKTIAVAPIPDNGLGLAINDRLRRAAAERP